jgi:hypothetical protein
MEQPKYWMVHCVNGSGSPNMKHHSKNEAVKEAKRLAFNCPNSNFAVLEVVACYMKPSDGAYEVRIGPPDNF